MDTHGETSRGIGTEVATAAAEAVEQPEAPEAAAATAAAAVTRTAAVLKRVDGKSIFESAFSTW